MSTYELLPEGRLKLLVGTSELSTGFLDSFRSLWKPATQAIGGPTLQQVSIG